jgi:hypothetical protein
MPEFIPEPVRARLGDKRAERLRGLLLLIERVLRRVYEMDATDHDPSIGDNASLFGQKIWHHCWFALEQELEDWDEVTIMREDHTFRIRIWMLTIAVYKVGDSESDSIYDVDFTGSSTKKAYAERNYAQLQLFPFEAVERPEHEHAFELNDLWVAHFGNPREQLVKLYIGAPTRDDANRNQWAWSRRIDIPSDGGNGTRQPVEPQPFDDLSEPSLDVALKQDAEENVVGGE